MKPFLMGAETEYAVSGTNGSTMVPTREIHSLLYRALQRERHWLADVVGGEALYLENGGRFYLDYGCHPEYATAECHTPKQVAAYDKAGERLLDLARRRVEQERPGMRITILKNNLNPVYPDDVTWGNHESYTSWVDPNKAAQALMAHMVSRTIYAGAGCLSGYAGGTGFELSQRARHIHNAVSAETTGDRPLFCTRVRKISDGMMRRGWTRAHLISKDSQRSPFGIYLTCGVTGLLFLLLNEGHTLGDDLDLDDPVVALRKVSCDPWLKQTVQLCDGRRLTALEIQHLYLEACERRLPGSDLPEWTREVVRHWGETLATLERDPLRMARKLDPYYKLFVFDHELKRTNCSWGEMRNALEQLTLLRQEYAANLIRAILDEDDANLDGDDRLRFRQEIDGMGPERERRLETMRLAIRLQQMDVQYHEVGGLYDRLVGSGHLQSVVLNDEEMERATREAPAGGRASIRGELIRHMRDSGWRCEWRYLYHANTGEFVDMRDPFGGRFEPSTWSRVYADQPNDADVMEIASQLGLR